MSRSTVFGRGPEKDFDKFLTDNTRPRLLVEQLQGKRRFVRINKVLTRYGTKLVAILREVLEQRAAPRLRGLGGILVDHPLQTVVFTRTQSVGLA